VLPHAVVDIESLGLAARLVQGEHEQLAEPFPEGMLDQQCPQLSDRHPMLAERDVDRQFLLNPG